MMHEAPGALIYLNNAGTSWPKPAAVQRAVEATLVAPPPNWQPALNDAQRSIAGFFGIRDPARLLFTGSCTAALSTVLERLPWQPGERLITSTFEHHALGLPAARLTATRGVEHLVAPPQGEAPVDLQWVEDALRRGGVRLVAMSMASNVTGALLPISALASLAHRHGALLLVDAAQAAGVVPVDVEALAADIMTFAGHKGPLGPHGVGGLYIAPEVELAPPAREHSFAGTAALSYCDLGSINAAGVMGMAAGISWLRERGMDAIRERIRLRTAQLLAGLDALDGVTIYGPTSADSRAAAVSITVAGIEVAALGAELAAAGVVVSAGKQCAPMSHAALGTSHGTVRLSAGPMTSAADIDGVLEVLRALVRR